MNLGALWTQLKKIHVIRATVALGVLIALVIGGWYLVAQHNISHKNAKTAASFKPAAPMKFTNYTNTAANISFEYPEKWGTPTPNTTNPSASLALDLNGLTFILLGTSKPQQVAVSFTADSQCQFVSASKTWLPAGKVPPADCTPETAKNYLGTNVYGIKSLSEGFYGHSEVFALKDGRLLQVKGVVGLDKGQTPAEFPTYAQVNKALKDTESAAAIFIAHNQQLLK